RTPLHVLIGHADLLGEAAEQDSEVQRAVHSIRREALELLALVDGILDLARLEAGELPIHRSTFALASFLDPLREPTEDLLRNRDVRLRWEIPPTLALESDPGKVREIARNLLSNAVKYTQSGEICLSAAPAGGGIELIVADTGVGIAPEDVDVIFE